MTRKKKIALGVVALLALGAVVLVWRLRPEALDNRFTGAYRVDPVGELGEAAIVVPSAAGGLRLRYPATGASRPLWSIGGRRFRVGSAGTPVPPSRQPEEVVDFVLGADSRAASFTRYSDGRVLHTGERLPFREERFSFTGDELSLRAKLVLPKGPGPHPAVVIVHGSGKESAVDTYDSPYLFAPHGIATLVYDKRGTGGSDGTYTQNFHVLARDVIAAVDALRSRDEIESGNIHLSGYSQGGWIAPLAAARTTGIRSLLIGYGPMVPIVDEDRWGYVYTLGKEGHGGEALAAADRIHETLVRIIDHGESERWDELAGLLEEAEGQDWFDDLAGSDSTLGFLSAHRWLPLWAVRLYGWWMMRPIDGEPRADRLYDPEPVVAELEVPSLWIFGGDDHSMPTEWTVEKLRRLQDQGSPVEILVYPEADHGILRFDRSAGKERRFIGYEPTYHRTQVQWLRRQSGLAAAEPAGDAP